MTLLDRRVGTVLGSELDLLGKLPPPNSSINFNAVSRPDETLASQEGGFGGTTAGSLGSITPVKGGGNFVGAISAVSASWAFAPNARLGGSDRK